MAALKSSSLAPLSGVSNIRLVLPDRVLPDAWIAFSADGIAGYGQGRLPEGIDGRDGGSGYLCPGFVDLHVHGGGGADFLDATPEAFLRCGSYHLSRGTTALCPTLATATYARIAAALGAWETAVSRSSGRLLPLHLEGPHLNRSKAGAQDPQLMHAPTAEETAWLLEHAAGIAQITLAPELPGALDFIERMRLAGITLSAGHSEARGPELRAAIARGLSKVTHLYNAMTYAAKHGITRDAGAVEFALGEDALGCELIADGIHAAPDLLRLAYRTKGAGGLALISDALAGVGMPIGTEFPLGLVRCVVEKNYCRLADGTALAGSTTCLIDQVRLMVQCVGVPMAEAVRMASLTPARLIGVDDRLGQIAPGRAADLVLFDETFAVRDVWVGGRRTA